VQDNTHSGNSAGMRDADENRPGEDKAAPTGSATKQALIYLRVSSASQLGGDYDRDGFSLPAQREACERKAVNLDAEVAEAFVERGESGKATARRSALSRMLERLKRGDIDYVIVHKLDRLARNRADDVSIVAQIRASGAQLVSVSENIDETPSGLLLHGIMSSIAEFYSQNLAQEVVKGTTEKAKKGGTPYKAPLGYLNRRHWVTDDGQPGESGDVVREVRTVVLDPDRAPHIRSAFTLYATGNYALSDLAAILEERGFRTRASRKAPSRAVGITRLQEILRHEYYLGIVRYRGQIYPGRHEALVDEATFQQVQLVLDAQRIRGATSWRHFHYLSGSIYCASCGGRLIYSRHRGNGGLYEYFVCAGRQAKTCQQPYHRIEVVEDAIERFYAGVTLTQSERSRAERDLRQRLDRIAGRSSVEVQRATDDLLRLKAHERKLLDAHYGDEISPDLFSEEQTRIRRQRVAAMSTIERLTMEGSRAAGGLDAALALLEDAQASYLRCDGADRGLMNQAIFERIEIDVEQISRATLARPFDAIVDASKRRAASCSAGARGSNAAMLRTGTSNGAPGGAVLSNSRTSDLLFPVDGSSFGEMVGETGFEPATARPPAGCATRLRHSPWPCSSGRRESNPP
jgi:site-specific DNA recombinase